MKLRCGPPTLLTRRRWTTVVGAAVLILLCPGTALAHTQGGEATGLLSGLQHPVSGLDHILAMVAVGLWGAQLGRPAVWLLPVTFPMVMAFGGMLGLMGFALPGIEIGIAASAIMMGVVVAFEARPPLWLAAALVGFFAIFHGHAHGTELPPGTDALLYSIGFVIATGCLHATGIGVGLVHRWPVGQAALRVAGVVVALAGLGFLWQAVA
jgi:urease accessory protein